MKTKKKPKLAGLNPKLQPKNKREYMDQDYVHLLSDSEKKLLSEFNEEFYNGYYPNKDKAHHNTETLRRDTYSRNNSINRDAISIAKTGKYVDYPDASIGKTDMYGNEMSELYGDSPEDAYIRMIDEADEVSSKLDKESNFLKQHKAKYPELYKNKK